MIKLSQQSNLLNKIVIWKKDMICQDIQQNLIDDGKFAEYIKLKDHNFDSDIDSNVKTNIFF